MGDNTSIATAWLIAVVLSVVLPRAAAVAGTPPLQADIDRVNVALSGDDPAARDAAVRQVNGWLDGGCLPIEVWSTWLPALERAGRAGDVADLSLKTIAGTASQPPPGAVGVVLAFRTRACVVALSASIDPVNHCHLW